VLSRYFKFELRFEVGVVLLIQGKHYRMQIHTLHNARTLRLDLYLNIIFKVALQKIELLRCSRIVSYCIVLHGACKESRSGQSVFPILNLSSPVVRERISIHQAFIRSPSPFTMPFHVKKYDNGRLKVLTAVLLRI
jgi:hypothetical protein